MFKKAFYAASLSILVTASAFAQAIDQQQTLSNQDRTYVNTNTGQSFTPTMNMSLGAGVLVDASYGLDYTTVLTVKLFGGGLPNNGGTELASATTTQLIPATQTVWVDAFWNAPVSVTPGTTYYLTFLDSHDEAHNFEAVFRYQTSNVYAGGEFLFAESTDEDAAYTSIPSFDLAFREYGENVVATPEPASLTLFATGIAGLMIVRRRRQNT